MRFAFLRTCRNKVNNCHYLFSGVNQDPCSKNTKSTQKQIMFTTCTDEEFTCNDGLCINIEKRWQIKSKYFNPNKLYIYNFNSFYKIDVIRPLIVWMNQMKTTAKWYLLKRTTKKLFLRSGKQLQTLQEGFTLQSF